MKFSMTGQENGDLLTQVTVWTGLTVLCFPPKNYCKILLDTTVSV
jgi:hypothetical protein